MNILEIKNNLVQLVYEENVKLASFIKIYTDKTTYIAQILRLQSSRIAKIAIAKIIFNYNGQIQRYDGSIPAINSKIELMDDRFFLELLDNNNPLLIGLLNEEQVILSSSLLEDNPVIFSEKIYQYKPLLETIIKQSFHKQTVVIDTSGELNGNKLIAGKDFKLPLNKYSIDYVFENGFENATSENKIFIRNIFAEINNYIKQVEYIPFNDFYNVVDNEYKRTNMLQLIMLKNRLAQFEKKNIFAQKPYDFEILKECLNKKSSLIIDLSKLSSSIQTEYIYYIYSVLEKHSEKINSFVMLDNENSNKELLNYIYGSENICSTIICAHSYKYTNILKQHSKNMFLFTPVKQINDFASYNILLNRLAEDEFIIYGKSTKFTPLIIKTLTDLSGIKTPDITNIINENVIKPEIQNDTQINITEEKKEKEDAEPINITTESEQQENIQEVAEEFIPQPEEQVTENITINTEESKEEPEEEQQIQELSDNFPTSETIIKEDNNEQVQIIENNDIKTEELVDDEIISDISIDITDEDIAEEIQKNNDDTQIIIENTPAENILQENNQITDNFEPDNYEQNNEEDLTDEELDLIDELESEPENTNSDDILNPQTEEVEIPIQNEVLENPEVHPADFTEVNKNDTVDTNLTETIDQTEEAIINKESVDNTPLDEKTETENKEINQAENNANPAPIDTDTQNETLKTKPVSTPVVPVYSAEIPDEDIVDSDALTEGDIVSHVEFGKGTVEKIINYGDKILYSINFDTAGRKLLDPRISELKKIQ